MPEWVECRTHDCMALAYRSRQPGFKSHLIFKKLFLNHVVKNGTLILEHDLDIENHSS